MHLQGFGQKRGETLFEAKLLLQVVGKPFRAKAKRCHTSRVGRLTMTKAGFANLV
jgi:hypothetical protein